VTADEPATENRPGAGSDDGGTYTLLLVRGDAGEIEVGALGAHHVPAGAYAYVGSALGTGGVARVDRHRRGAAGGHGTRHWHVDYLTGDPETRLADVVTTAGVDAECRVAAEVRRRVSETVPEPEPVAGFGASDCDCRTHLFAHESLGELRTVVSAAHDAVRK
jgi:Uri superfamily endonuclease